MCMFIHILERFENNGFFSELLLVELSPSPSKSILVKKSNKLLVLALIIINQIPAFLLDFEQNQVYQQIFGKTNLYHTHILRISSI